MAPSPTPLLSIRDLVTSFRSSEESYRAVDQVSFDIPEAGTVGLVGESGCGKSVTALSILRLLNSPPARIESGQILLRGSDLLALPERKMRAIRGNEISMIFQEPMTSLNPVFTVGAQIVEAVRLHQSKSRSEARSHAVEMLRWVGIASPEQTADAFPHQLSGGQRQRVMIAIAIACQPSLLIADEPTTALDVTIQAQILRLFARLRAETKTSLLLITHDLGVVAESVDTVVVMYAGQVVERAATVELFRRPLHPYTRGLLASLPGRNTGSAARRRHLPAIAGMVPDVRALPKGCRFKERCSFAKDECGAHEIDLMEVEPGRFSRCIRASEVSS